MITLKNVMTLKPDRVDHKKVLCLSEIEYEEEWVEVQFPDPFPEFMVSNYGRVLRLSDNKIMPQYYDKDGYTRVGLYVSKKRKTIAKTHRLVALHFIPNDDPIARFQVNHKNTLRDYNYVSNLEWSSPQENMDHKVRCNNQRYLRGEDKVETKHKESDVHEICVVFEKGIRKTNDVIEYLNKGHLPPDKLKSYKILINNLRNRHIWSYITKEYKY